MNCECFRRNESCKRDSTLCRQLNIGEIRSYDLAKPTFPTFFSSVLRHLTVHA